MDTPNDQHHEAAQQVVEALVSLLRPKLASSPQLQTLVHAIGELLIHEADRASQLHDHSASSADQSTMMPHTQASDGAQTSQRSGKPRIIQATPIEIKGPRAIVPMKIGDAEVELEVRGDAGTIDRARQAALTASHDEAGDKSEFKEIDLSLIETRARLKAKACRAVVHRRAQPPSSPEEKQATEAITSLIPTAKALHECYLWMINRDYPQPDDEHLNRIARWYDALADAAHAMVLVDSSEQLYDSPRAYQSDVKEAMQHLAHATAGLRHAMIQANVSISKPDTDQDETHQWLKWETKLRSVFIERYMRADDVPEPDSIDDLQKALGEFVQSVQNRISKAREEDRLLKKIAYHTDQLATHSSLDEQHDWKTIEQTLIQLLENGLAADSTRLGMVLDPLKELDIPDPASCPNTSECLAALRLSLTTTNDLPKASPVSVRAYSREVAKVADMLRGKRMVLIGGEQRGDAIERLKEAFELEDVDWVALTEHGSTLPAKAPIERANTALVAVLLKLAGHQHVTDAKGYAKDAGKPFIVLKAGYNPEQVALAVLEQASKQLSKPA